MACGGTGFVARTYLDASFCNYGIQRLLMVDTSLTIQTVNAVVPQWNVIWVIVNSTIYGGSGGAIALFSKHQQAHEIALHELGHTAFNFADEYACYACTPQEEQQGLYNHHPAQEPLQPNVTTALCQAKTQWQSGTQGLSCVKSLEFRANPACQIADKCGTQDWHVTTFVHLPAAALPLDEEAFRLATRHGFNSPLLARSRHACSASATR